MTQSLVDGVPTRRLMDDPARWSSGLFYDWTHGLADAIHHAGKDRCTQVGWGGGVQCLTCAVVDVCIVLRCALFDVCIVLRCALCDVCLVLRCALFNVCIV